MCHGNNIRGGSGNAGAPPPAAAIAVVEATWPNSPPSAPIDEEGFTANGVTTYIVDKVVVMAHDEEASCPTTKKAAWPMIQQCPRDGRKTHGSLPGSHDSMPRRRGSMRGGSRGRSGRGDWDLLAGPRRSRWWEAPNLLQPRWYRFHRATSRPEHHRRMARGYLQPSSEGDESVEARLAAARVVRPRVQTRP
jgi:hypothetical protein